MSSTLLSEDTGVPLDELQADQHRSGRSYVGEPDQLAEELREDAAVGEADTLLLTVPDMPGVEYNARLLGTTDCHVAPAIGRVPPEQGGR